MRHEFRHNRRSGEFGYASAATTAAGCQLSQLQQQQQLDTLDPRLEVRSDILHHRRRHKAASGVGGGDWSSLGGDHRDRYSGGRTKDRYGDVQLTDFGLIDYPPPPPFAASETGETITKNNNNNKSQPATVRKGLLWVQKDRLFSRNRFSFVNMQCIFSLVQ